jgi:hypothetical protein
MRLYYDKQGKPQLARTRKTRGESISIAKPKEGKIRYTPGGLLGGEQHAQIFLGGKWQDCYSEQLAYLSAKKRCENPKDTHWKDYGGRGILFKFVSFYQFINHAGLKPSLELSIDRINNDGHYTIGNVRWATVLEQAHNRRPRKSS